MRRQRITANDLERRLAIPQTFPITFAYVPVSFVDDDVILDDTMMAIGNATYYHFGILSSAAHVAWLCCAAKPTGMEFNYTPQRVYNTFPWPADITDAQRTAVENAAQMIERVRESMPGFTFAEHYTVDGMPAELKEAHRINDAAVFAAYGLPPDASGCEIIACLKTRYDVAVAAYKPKRPIRERSLPHWRRGE